MIGKKATQKFKPNGYYHGNGTFRLFSNSFTSKEKSRMKRLNQIHPKLSLCVFAAMVMATGPAMGAISLPTAVQFEKAISFQKPDGEPIQLKAGIYEVELGEEKELKFDPIGAGDEITVQALPANHNEDIEEMKALLTPAPDKNPDKQHVILWMPDGVALEAIGSYSGVFTRSTLTWATSGEGDDAAATDQEPLTVNLEKALYFKTAGGDPKIIKPGDYEVGLADDGMVLAPVGGKPEDAVTIEPESLGTSAALIIPEMNDNPNFQALVVATVGGQSLIAIGSQDGTFTRGWKNWAKKKAKSAGSRVKKRAKKGVRATYGKAKKHGGKYAKKGRSAARKYGRKYGRKAARAAYKSGKGVVTRFCKSKAAQAAASSTAYGTAATGGCIAVKTAQKLR